MPDIIATDVVGSLSQLSELKGGLFVLVCGERWAAIYELFQSGW